MEKINLDTISKEELIKKLVLELRKTGDVREFLESFHEDLWHNMDTDNECEKRFIDVLNWLTFQDIKDSLVDYEPIYSFEVIINRRNVSKGFICAFDTDFGGYVEDDKPFIYGKGFSKQTSWKTYNAYKEWCFKIIGFSVKDLKIYQKYSKEDIEKVTKYENAYFGADSSKNNGWYLRDENEDGEILAEFVLDNSTNKYKVVYIQ